MQRYEVEGKTKAVILVGKYEHALVVVSWHAF